jgi:hypothetical protein
MNAAPLNEFLVPVLRVNEELFLVCDHLHFELVFGE